MPQLVVLLLYNDLMLHKLNLIIVSAAQIYVNEAEPTLEINCLMLKITAALSFKIAKKEVVPQHVVAIAQVSTLRNPYGFH